ncbi:MAG TPA: primosomal protein N' [Anaerolineales bacterium]|jgi:primosomal protein N' (replication factor Y)|nr:primosomal protein N' [Anaerolineales bacterium]HQX14971.1 primosomal protein N' [Anaerolineales bacterium]
MTSFVQIVVNAPAIAGVFDYSIPESLAGTVGVGHLVIVPFGKQTVQGVVLRFIDQPSVRDVKEVIELVDPEPVLTQAQIALAEEMAKSTLAPLAAIAGLFLPVGLSQQVDTIYDLRLPIADLRLSGDANEKSVSPKTQRLTIENRLLNLLRTRGALRGRQIDTHFAKVDWRKTAGFLVRKGMLSAKSVLPPPRVRSKFIRVAQLAVTPEEADVEMPNLGMKQTLARRQSALRFLIRQPDAINVSWVYAESGCNLADLQELEERGLIRLFESEVFRDPLEKTGRQVDRETSKQVIELTPDQTIALNELLNSIMSPHATRPTFLLYGVTGSGKTEIYLRAAEEVVKRGEQVIVLVPEIALTPQAVRRFLNRFPGQVGLVHSKLSEGERYDTWRRARAGKLKVIIGARSALFAPLPNIGLIVADECHDSSFHQAEPPFYHAVDAAQTYARLCGAVCVLGSATPTITQRFRAQNPPLPEGEGLGVRVLSLPNRIVESGLPPIHIVDMRDELKAGQRGIFSRLLLRELDSTLQRGEQAILFLNRRGTSTYVFCRDCGYVLKCPNCDTPLTFHVEDKERLLCHQCGYERQKPKTCPQCGGKQIREFGLGSEKVEAEVNALFPKARTLRWDWDTTRQKDAHEMILTHFANHKADVLIGTQMLAKGLDLPMVTLVGIVLADVGLHLPDPFASERVFQVLTQVAGRAGRGERGGKVILQTFDPTNQVIQSAARHDVDGFYQYELENRKRLGYPPYTRLVRLEFRSEDQPSAEKEAKRVAEKLSIVHRPSSNVIGPVPCFFSKVAGFYRWQIILRGSNPKEILRDVKLDGWRVEVDPISLL